jgi:hypothetical protein
MGRRLSAKEQAKSDAFDDALAETGSVREAAAHCGMTLVAAEARFTRMRKKLGWQAQ